jgi:predicted DNA-binding transcriptional regulator AlpA
MGTHNPRMRISQDRTVGRKVDMDELVGSHEIAHRLGVARSQVIHEWRLRHRDFPQPVATLKTALIWDWREIESWARDLKLCIRCQVVSY